MRTGFVAGVAFLIGIAAGAFIVGPAIHREHRAAAVVQPPPQSTPSLQTADPFQTARNEGDAAMDGGRCEAAVAAYERALSMKFDPDIATDRGVCLRQLGRRAEARAAFEFITLKTPAHWKSRYNLTAMLIEAGQTDDARKSLLLLRNLGAEPDAINRLEKALAAPR